MIVKSAQSAPSRHSKRRIAKGPCERAYWEAKAVVVPLRSASALEKLRQYRGELDAIEVTLFAIAKMVKSRQSQPTGLLEGGCCTTEDKGVWLKSLPKTLAWSLGRFALQTSASDHAKANFQEQVTKLLTDCEVASAIVKPSVEIEYKAMRTGESLMLPLILRTRVLLCFAFEEWQVFETAIDRLPSTTIDSARI